MCGISQKALKLHRSENNHRLKGNTDSTFTLITHELIHINVVVKKQSIHQHLCMRTQLLKNLLTD